MTSMRNRVTRSLENMAGPLDGQAFLVACSGGRDSVALLALMIDISRETSSTVGVFHMDHQLRGQESLGDARFVQHMAEEYGIPFFLSSVDVKLMRPKHESLEETARRVRYREMEKVRVANNFSWSCTAHTMDDQVETILYRVFRGTGFTGLSGIKSRNEQVLRPMLDITSDEISGFFDETGLTWREDSSNQDFDFARNAIRHDIIPVIEKHFPGFREPVNRLSHLGNQYRDYIFKSLKAMQGEMVMVTGNRVVIYYRDMQPWILAETIRHHLFLHSGLQPGLSAIDEIFKNLESPASWRLLFSHEDVIVRKGLEGDHPVIIIESPTVESGPWEVDVKLSSGNRILELNPGTEVSLSLPDHMVDEQGWVHVLIPVELTHITLRNRRPGDRIRLVSGTKKLKDLFIDRKIDPFLKDNIIVLDVQGHVAALLFPGFPKENTVSRDFLVKGSTIPASKKILAMAQC